MSLFHKHRWKLWYDNGMVTWYLAGHVGDKRFRTKERMEQIRECETCGMKQRRFV